MISGSAKGKRLKTLDSILTRPTSDRVKEALFNVLMNCVEDANVLDLFAGTGNLGIEALSRGAKHCTFIDANRACGSLIRENLNNVNFLDKSSVFVNDSFRAIALLRGKKFDLIIMDPPYHKDLIHRVFSGILENDILAKDGLIIAEHSQDDILDERFEELTVIRSKKYGSTVLSVYRYYIGQDDVI